MLFNSIEFLVFLPIVFTLYWLLSRKITIQNLLIVISSYIFYGWWDWRFLLLISFTSVYSFLCGILLEKAGNRKSLQKVISASNIILNLGILCLFKYYNFFTENLNVLLDSFGFKLDLITLNIILPVGISFYTFQALSYTIDVYKKKIEATHDIIAFLAYISYFPQLVAGPIERATNLLPQITARRKFNYSDAIDGIQQIIWGFFKKMVIADNCSVIVDVIFAFHQQMGWMQLLLGGILFAFQIYGDFSGYSDIAIGTSKLFGIKLMRNFNFPYLSRDIAEFWRRWHISLNTWFRDYLYIPLGGSRNGLTKSIRNVFIIFLVSGLWHGANWTYITWGAYHAFLFIPLMLMKRNRKYRNDISSDELLPNPKESLQILSTFILVVIGWIIFRAENIIEAWEYIYRIVQFAPPENNMTFPKHSLEVLVYIFILCSIEWCVRTKEYGLQIQNLKSKGLRIAIYTAILLLIEFTMGDSSTFIYFQF